MKKLVTVTITKELEIEIPDEYLTPEHFEMFESGLFELNGDSYVEKVNCMFGYAAEMVAKYDTGFIEGLAMARYCRGYDKKPGDVLYHELYEEVETEVVDV